MTIANFSTIAPGIFRGGQPAGDDWAYLQSLGVKQVIKLNSSDEGSDAAAQAHGMELFYAPISLTQQILTEPDLQAIRDVVGFIGPGTFIHCTHGWDRTGLIVGLFRVACGWTKGQAWQEMLEHGFHRELLGLLKAWEDLTR